MKNLNSISIRAISVLSIWVVLSIQNAHCTDLIETYSDSTTLTRDDVLESINHGIFFQQSAAETDNNSNIYNSLLHIGYHQLVMIQLRLSSLQFNGIDNNNYIPSFFLISRPFSSVQFKLKYVKSKLRFRIQNSTTHPLQREDLFTVNAQPQWIYSLRLEFPGKIEIVPSINPAFLYHFPEYIYFTYLSQNSILIDANYGPNSTINESQKINYVILDGIDKISIEISDNNYTIDEFNLSALLTSKLGLALLGELKQNRISQTQKEQDNSSVSDTESFIHYKSTRLNLIYSSSRNSIAVFRFNRFQAELQGIYDLSNDQDYLFETNQFSIKTISILGNSNYSLKKIKNNRDHFLGFFPARNEGIFETNFCFSTKEKLHQIFAESKYGVLSSFYLKVGGFYTDYSLENSSIKKYGLTYGFGICNYNLQELISIERTDRSDLLGRLMPPGKFRFELKSVRSINDNTKMIRRHEFDGVLGLPFGFNLSFQRKISDYWRATDISIEYFSKADPSSYLDYYSWTPALYTNSFELKKILWQNLMLSVKYIYDERNISEANEFIRGHEIFGDYSFKINLAYYFKY